MDSVRGSMEWTSKLLYDSEDYYSNGFNSEFYRVSMLLASLGGFSDNLYTRGIQLPPSNFLTIFFIGLLACG
jgi:hypothetical protein